MLCSQCYIITKGVSKHFVQSDENQLGLQYSKGATVARKNSPMEETLSRSNLQVALGCFDWFEWLIGQGGLQGEQQSFWKMNY